MGLEEIQKAFEKKYDASIFLRPNIRAEISKLFLERAYVQGGNDELQAIAEKVLAVEIKDIGDVKNIYSVFTEKLKGQIKIIREERELLEKLLEKNK